MQKWLRDRGQAVPIIHIDGLILSAEMEEPEKISSHGMATERMDHTATGHNPSHRASASHEETKHSETTHSAMGHDKMSHTEMVHDAQKPKSMDHAKSDSTTTGNNDHNGMGHHSMEHHHNMPGMLSQAQLEELASLRGSEFDRTFLTFMIEHHQGAVFMVNQLFEADGAGNDEESYRLAADIYAEQVTEIEMMKLMLGEMAASLAPSGHHNHR